MAATITKVLSIGNKLFIHSLASVQGTGVPADGDDIATNIRRFPVGSEYINTATGKVYKRVAAALVAADWAILN